MSHSTHSGLSRPPGCWRSLGHFTITARHTEFRTHVASPSPLVGLAPLRLLLPQTVGVGALSATHDPDSVPLVADRDLSAISREGGFICSQHTPSRIKPQRGQVSENGSESPNNESWTVFHEDESRSNFANDPSKLTPEPRSCPGDPCPFAGNADVLAWKAATDDIHTSSPGFPVEAAHVVPYREGLQGAVVLAGHESFPGVWGDFNGADCSPPEQIAAENSASIACEKCQLIHAPPQQTQPPPDQAPPA